MFDKFREECGVFGISGHPEASNLAYLGLYALQHRGQESAGIAASDGIRIRHSKAMGYVNEAFNGQTLSRLEGHFAIGHVRYSTAGESRLTNAQPIVIDCMHGPLALCHNGNLVNAGELREELDVDSAGSISCRATQSCFCAASLSTGRASGSYRSERAIINARLARLGRSLLSLSPSRGLSSIR